MLEKPSTWKKLSAISQSSAHPGSMAVKYDRSYHLQDEDETEVESGNAVKGTGFVTLKILYAHNTLRLSLRKEFGSCVCRR